jgi:hypothetical protein
MQPLLRLRTYENIIKFDTLLLVKIIKFMLFIPCLFLTLIHQPTNTLNKIKFMTVRMEQRGFQWNYIHEILYLKIFFENLSRNSSSMKV